MSQILNFAQMNGAQSIYRDRLFRASYYTSGVVYVATELRANWLLSDMLTVLNVVQKLKTAPFVSWTLSKSSKKDVTAVLKADDGNGNTLYRQKYEATDFDFSRIPEEGLHKNGKSITFFYENNLLMLPEER